MFHARLTRSESSLQGLLLLCFVIIATSLTEDQINDWRDIMGIIIYLALGIFMEFVVVRIVEKRTERALVNSNVIFRKDNEITNEHFSISSENVNFEDEIVEKATVSEIREFVCRNFKWWNVITNVASLALWPITMPVIILLFTKWTTDEAIVNDLLSNK